MIARYAEMIQACLGSRTEWHADSRRPVDRAVAAYWNETASAETLSVESTLVAANGERVAVAAWTALARRDSAVINAIARSQQPTGSYFTSGRADNLETLWYWELVVLHALAAYGTITGSPPLLESAKRAAAYHLNETQPDHATTEPWGLNAFLLSKDTYPLADQVLHTVHVQHPSGAEGISAILLADTLRHLKPHR